MSTEIKTTNWNNMNFYRKTVRTESLDRCLIRRKHQDKVRIVQKHLKKLHYVDTKRMVVVSSRRYGKSTAHRLYTRFLSLKILESALVARDRLLIKSAINQRINARGKRCL